MTTRTAFLSKAKSYVGTKGRPNTFTRWYARRHGSEFAKAPWCAMFLSYVASSVKLGKQVGEYAYCPYWVNWFKKNGQWGTTPKPGAIVFFDWNRDKEADHVGVVEYVRGKTVYTIEGNKGDKVERVARSGNILGYGYPSYPVNKTKTHTVRAGDTLSSIALHYYRDPGEWRDIYAANRKTIGPNPALIRPGMKLTLP